MMHNPRYLLMLALIVGVYAFAKAQSTPPVELIEDKQPKRWLLYAQNNTNQDQEVFLMVKGQGFRRSADRPVIKNIPPDQKVLMITLIPLRGETPSYTKIFTWENNLKTITKRKGEDDEVYVNIRPLKDDELTVFTKDGCEKCEVLIHFLETNHYKFRKLDLKTNERISKFMFDHLREANYKGGIIDLPVIFYQGRKHWSINDIQKFIENYDWSDLD